MATVLYRLGRFSHRARRLVVPAWLLVVVALGAASATLSGPTASSFSIPGTESQEAQDLLAERFADVGVDRGSARVVFVAEDGELTEPRHRHQIDGVLGELAAAPEVVEVTDPFRSGLVSEDDTTAIAEVRYDVPGPEVDPVSLDALLDIVGAGATADLTIEVGGDAVEPLPEVGAELAGLVVAAVVLVLTLGSLVAAGMPLATGITGVLLGVLGITAATGFIDLGATTPILALMLGLAVGIDYALFIVSRYRHELAAGHGPEEAAGRAVGTAGSAVVFAGLTVVIALAGLSVVGIGLLTEMGVAAAGTVAVTVVVALTLLPALLGFAGRRVLPRRQRVAEDATAADPGRSERPTLGGRWVDLVIRRPLATLTAAVAVVGVLALPALDLHLGLPDQGTYPEHTTQRQAYDAIADGFGPGFNGPLVVAVDAAGAVDPQQASAAVHAALDASDRVVLAAPPELNAAGDTAIIAVVPTTGPDTAGTEQLVDEIRTEVRAVGAQSGADVAVTGHTALLIDFNAMMAEALWVYLAVVIGLSLVLLTAVFRSVVVPIKATVGFLLSVGATFGALVAIFQWGWLAGVGIQRTDAVVSLLPIFIIGVVFGLAMDYEVFLVTRMREEHVHGADAVVAVRHGFRHGARVVAAAATIMISVFAGFVLGDAADIIQIGVALAVAVAVDAFVVRMTIVPAVMALLGERAWWLPRWLDRLLPDLDVEGERLRRELEPTGPARTGAKMAS